MCLFRVSHRVLDLSFATPGVCEEGGEWRELVRVVGTVFSDGERLNSDGFLPPPQGADSNYAPLGPMDCQPCLLLCSLQTALGIDLVLVGKLYEAILSPGREELENALSNGCELLLNNLVYQAQNLSGPAGLRQIVIMLQSPLLVDPGYANIVQKLVVCVDKLSATNKDTLASVFEWCLLQPLF